MKRSLITVTFLIFVLAVNSCGSHSDVFGGAKWIGPSGSDLSFYPDYMPVFKIEFDINIKSGKSGAILYGLNDPRLLNANLNKFNLENQRDSSFIKVEFGGDGKVSVYRKGYCPTDREDKPLATFDTEILSGSNHIVLDNNLGHFNLYVNGEKAGYVGLNPNGNGGDYLAFPVLAEMKVEIADNAEVTFSNLKIKNFRKPSNIIWETSEVFSESSKIDCYKKSMPEVRTYVSIPKGKKIAEASIVCTARGIYDLYVNGNRITDDYFNPGSTQYNKTHQYHKFDLTHSFHTDENEIIVKLAEGWWAGASTFVGENWNFYGDRLSFIARIDVEYTDGTHDRFLTTPQRWYYSVDGPLEVASFFQGEIYNAAQAANSGRIWKPAVEISTDSTVNLSVGNWENIEFVPTFGDRVISVDTVNARSMTEPRSGVYVYDMGQNMAGVPLITFGALYPHQEVTLRYAEMVYPDMPCYKSNQGMIMTENLRAAMCRDIYIAEGKKGEVFSPRFTLHGYRYLELTGITEPLPLESVKSLVISSIHAFKAHYECSDSLVNRLWNNIKWSSLSNFISIPTDCPQRNERLGWMGDISVFVPTATKIADVSNLLRQYLRSVRDCQEANGRFLDVAPTGFGFGGLLWGSAGIIVPWECYRQYGDINFLKEHYTAMKRYIDYILNHTVDPATQIIVQRKAWSDLGDWLSSEYNKTDKSLLWECYFIYDLEIMSNVARLLELEEEAIRYDQLRNERTALFVDNYIDKVDGKTIWSGFDIGKKGEVIDTQVSYALPIALGIYNEEKFIKNFLNTLKRENTADDGTLCPPYSLMTGFIGTAWIMDALSKTGNLDIAYRLLTSRSYPSWLYPVTQGASTVWERLNSYTHKDGFGKNNSMNSFNHYSFGSVGNWLLTHSIGINVNDDGSIEIKPDIDPTGSITFARGWLDTPLGRVYSGWKVEGDRAICEIDLPEKCKGLLLFKEHSHRLSTGHNIVTLSIGYNN